MIWSCALPSDSGPCLVSCKNGSSFSRDVLESFDIIKIVQKHQTITDWKLAVVSKELYGDVRRKACLPSSPKEIIVKIKTSDQIIKQLLNSVTIRSVSFSHIYINILNESQYIAQAQ